MKKTEIIRESVFAAAMALGTMWLGVSALGAIELEVDPAIGSKSDGVYEVSKASPESFYSYSEPFDVVPGGLYRFAMNACWFGGVGGGGNE